MYQLQPQVMESHNLWIQEFLLSNSDLAYVRTYAYKILNMYKHNYFSNNNNKQLDPAIYCK